MAKINPNPAATKPNAEPTAADTGKKVKKEKKVRTDYFTTAGINRKDPKQFPLKLNADGTGTPSGFTHGAMKPLSKKDFEKTSAFFTYRAEALEAAAKRLREKAETIRKAGDTKAGSSKATRLLKIMSKAADLRKELADQGIDVDALLAATKPAPKAEEKAAAPATK